MNGNKNTNANARLTTLSLLALTAAALLAMPATAGSSVANLDQTDCSQVGTCGTVVADCLTQQAAGAGVSTSDSTEWIFRATNSYGGQSYSESGTGRTFDAKANFAVGFGGVIVVSATLTADGVVVASSHIGCA